VTESSPTELASLPEGDEKSPETPNAKAEEEKPPAVVEEEEEEGWTLVHLLLPFCCTP
jgi:hypothetical protein